MTASAALVLLLLQGAPAGIPSDSLAVSTPADTARAATEVKPVPKKRGLAGRAGHMVVSFASDVGFVATSPFRLSTKDALITAAVLGATAIVYSYDEEIRRATKRNEGTPVYDAMSDFGDAFVSNGFVDVGFMGDTWPYWVGGAVVSTALDIDPVQSICLDVIESHLIAGGLRNAAKFIIGRDHPFEADRSTFFVQGTSMPSGHTSVVFEVATILTRHTEGLAPAVQWGVGITSYGIATAVALQRVDSSAHWASDVILGGAMGALVANTVVNRNQERRRKEGLAGGGPTLVPTIDAAGQPALALSWRF